MPIISRIGRKHPRVRLLYLAIYVVLTAGALTMIYPFMIMVSGSTKSAVDIKDFDAIPRFLFDDAMLYRKHVEGLFNEALSYLQIAYDTDTTSFEKVEPPAKPNEALVREWLEFVNGHTMPHYSFKLGYMETPVSRTLPSSLRTFKKSMIDRYDGDIEKLNADLHTAFVGWNAFYVIPEGFLGRLNNMEQSRFFDVYRSFKLEQPPSDVVYASVQGFYKALFLKTQYTRDIEFYNKEHGTDYASYDDIFLSMTYPRGAVPREREDWEVFVRRTLGLLWIRVKPEAAETYRDFLRAKYGEVSALNRNYGTGYTSFGEVPLVTDPPEAGVPLSDWSSFIAGWKDPDTGIIHTPAADQLVVHSYEFLFQDALREKYGDVDKLNAELGTDVASFARIGIPQRDMHYLSFLEQRGELRSEFATRNYRAVTDYIVLHGRGILNTTIYCALAVLCALIFNPMAAYAMSRYKLRNTYKLLLFMLITMAFPPMVTQIPVFLMLRDFKMLNTFAALILPGLAHGYSIFLLKGFFDSLPRELYESAQIDGANEWVMFWRITMSLSKPILAVIALQAFTIAYANFMFALLICQDEKMWTLMVWLYQLQQRSGQAVMYASLIIAAVPTFVIFLFCQNIIMRGIVVPVEK